MNFAGQTVWITGASGGIGAALAQEWAGQGAHIILSGRDEDRLAKLAGHIQTDTLILPFDVRDDTAMRAATAQAIDWQPGGVDIFVANAGVSQRSLAIETSMQVYHDILEIDLIAPIAATQALLPHFTQRDSGHLLFISSISGKIGIPMRTAYCAAKHGLIGYADSLRSELSQSNISVHVICPGSTATDIGRNALVADGSKRGHSDEVTDNGIRPEDVARQIIDAVATGQREIIVAQGLEKEMVENRRTTDTLFDQVAAIVAAGYMEKC